MAMLKLGKLPARHDPRTVKLSRYLTAALSPAPPAVNFSGKAKQIGMLLNDQLGDCGPVAALHLSQCMTAENGVEFVPTDKEAIAAYEGIGGYVPGDPSTDNGVVLLNEMNFWRKTGIGGRKIAAYFALDLQNREHFKQTIANFGGVILGFTLPTSVQDADEWLLKLGSTDPTEIWGGHAVCSASYADGVDDRDGIDVISWGRHFRVSWPFLDTFCDEAYGVVSADWADDDGAPTGIALADLLADVSQVAA